MAHPQEAKRKTKTLLKYFDVQNLFDDDQCAFKSDSLHSTQSSQTDQLFVTVWLAMCT